MDCTEEELSKTNVFQLSILLPLIEVLDAYMMFKQELSPDEFCIYLFVKEGPTERCKFDYNPVRERYGNFEELKTLSGLMQNIIVDLFMTIIRYTTFLESISKDYLDKQNCPNYKELHQTMVLVYILSYKIFSLFLEESIECFVHFKVKKMLSLVVYLLCQETPNFFHEKGCSIFEEDFVEQKLVLPFLEATPYLEVPDTGIKIILLKIIDDNLRVNISQKVQGQLKEYIRNMKIPKKKLTTPVFMKVLNRPKVHAKVPANTPEDFSSKKFANEVPKTNYIRPATQAKLELLRATNKLNALNLLKDANEGAPSCLQRRRTVAKSVVKEKPKTSFVKRSVPAFQPVVVKQTTASTLRECARVISSEEKELKILRAVAEGGLDPSSILKFEEETRQQEREQELLKIEEKHLMALLSREGAFIAKQSLLNDVKAHAETVRKEKQELSDKLEKWRQNHNKEMAEVVEKCREIEHASREAFNAMIDEKKQKAAEITEESRQLKVQMIKQREEETQRKIKLIQEIKTIQSLRALPFKEFDPTESSGLGLLCEMSLAELKERLFWMKMKLNEEIKTRKSVIHREREKQKNMIKDTRKALEEYKESKRGTTLSVKSLQQPQSVTSPEIEALRKKLEERKALRLKKEVLSGSK